MLRVDGPRPDVESQKARHRGDERAALLELRQSADAVRRTPLVVVDKITEQREAGAITYLIFSEDDGLTWSDPIPTPATGIVPDRLLELESGRWIISTHQRNPETGNLAQHLWYSDDGGATWSERVTVADQAGLNLCEVSILPVEGRLVAFMRENSGLGRPCYKTISEDDGETWSEPMPFPLPGVSSPRGRLFAGRAHLHHVPVHARWREAAQGRRREADVGSSVAELLRCRDR